MTKRVLSVGQCGPDTAQLRALVERNFAAQLLTADTGEQACAALRSGHVDLVLVNRKLDIDYSDGLDIIRQIKADAELAVVPCMLVTNYAEHQQSAVAAGAEPGFGKLEFAQPETRAKLARFLE
jgi:CheY-like chemotaxis protein